MSSLAQRMESSAEALRSVRGHGSVFYIGKLRPEVLEYLRTLALALFVADELPTSVEVAALSAATERQLDLLVEQGTDNTSALRWMAEEFLEGIVSDLPYMLEPGADPYAIADSLLGNRSLAACAIRVLSALGQESDVSALQARAERIDEQLRKAFPELVRLHGECLTSIWSDYTPQSFWWERWQELEGGAS